MVLSRNDTELMSLFPDNRRNNTSYESFDGIDEDEIGLIISVVVAVIVLVTAFFFFCLRIRRQDKENDEVLPYVRSESRESSRRRLHLLNSSLMMENSDSSIQASSDGSAAAVSGLGQGCKRTAKISFSTDCYDDSTEYMNVKTTTSISDVEGKHVDKIHKIQVEVDVVTSQ